MYELGYWLGQAFVVAVFVLACVVGVGACIPAVRRGVRDGRVKARDMRHDVHTHNRFTWDAQSRIHVTKEPDDE